MLWPPWARGRLRERPGLPRRDMDAEAPCRSFCLPAKDPSGFTARLDDEDDEEDIGMEGAEKEGVIAMAGGCEGSYSRDILRARPLLFWEIEV